MVKISVLVLTAAPPGQAAEAGGAYVRIDGRECLLRAIELFLNRDEVKQVQLAVLPDMLEEAKQRFGANLSFSGVKLYAAGPRWIDQIAGGVEKLSADATHVLVHDAARPGVPYTDLEALLEAGAKAPAVALSAPVRTTLVEVDEGGSPLATHLPERFVHLLTPQLYSREKFLEMAGKKQEVHPSQLRLLKGSPLNVRVSGPGDATYAKAMLNLMPKPKVRASSPFEEAQW